MAIHLINFKFILLKILWCSIRADCPWSRAVREAVGKVLRRDCLSCATLARSEFERRLAKRWTDGVSQRSGALGLLGVGQDHP